MEASTSNEPTEEQPFAYPSGVKAADYVTVELSPQRYFIWKQLMLTFLEHHGLKGFVEAPIHKPDKPPALDMYSDLIDERWEEKKKIEEERQGKWNQEQLLGGNGKWDARLRLDYNIEWRKVQQLWKQEHKQKDLDEWEEWKKKWEKKLYEKLKDIDHDEWDLRVKWNEKAENRAMQKKKREGEERRYTGWKRSDGLVKGWILALVTQEMLLQVIHLETAREVWSQLEKILTPSFQLSRHNKIDLTHQERGQSQREYAELHKAALTADWDSATKFLDNNPDAVFQPITWGLETALIVAVRSVKRNGFVEKLIMRMVRESRRQELMKRMELEMMEAIELEMEGMEQERIKRMRKEIIDGMEGIERERMARILQEKMEGIEGMERERTKRMWRERMERMRREIIEWMEGMRQDTMERMRWEIIEGNPGREWELMKRMLREKMDHNMRGMEREMMERMLLEIINGIEGMERERMERMEREKRDSMERMLGKKITEIVPLLAEKDVFGGTALHAAVEGDNIDAAKWLVTWNPELANIEDNYKTLAVHVAARLGKGKMVEFLLPLTKNLSDSISGHKLLLYLASAGLYGHASTFLEKHPILACREPSPLVEMAQNCTSFITGASLKSSKRLYNSEPSTSSLQDKKSIHHQALDLVKSLCKKVVENDLPNAAKIFREPLMKATCLGIHEIVEEILWSFPSAIHLRNEMNQSIFHIAIVYRREKVFNLIHQMEEDQCALLSMPDASTNNALHLVGDLEPQQKLLLRASAAGAALQMQRELQWFKQVEKFILPQAKEHRNADGKTPQEVFTDTHEDLVKEGEKWMKGTANSCTIAAALITTILFAAAITVPGGSDINTGVPIQFGSLAFTLFGIFDAFALLASSISLIIFLSILTCRYGEHDFLHYLPTRMIFGLGTLFLSILSMMAAFAVTFIILFGATKAWISLVVLSFVVPVGVFGWLQFPLLLAMIQATYFSRLFREQSTRTLH